MTKKEIKEYLEDRELSLFVIHVEIIGIPSMNFWTDIEQITQNENFRRPTVYSDSLPKDLRAWIAKNIKTEGLSLIQPLNNNYYAFLHNQISRIRAFHPKFPEYPLLIYRRSLKTETQC